MFFNRFNIKIGYLFITEILQVFYKLGKPIEKQKSVMYNKIVQIKRDDIVKTKHAINL